LEDYRKFKFYNTNAFSTANEAVTKAGFPDVVSEGVALWEQDRPSRWAGRIVLAMASRSPNKQRSPSFKAYQTALIRIAVVFLTR